MVVKTLAALSTLTNIGAVILDEKTPVTIGAVIAFGGLIWYLGQMVQRMKDDIRHQSVVINQLINAVNKLPCGSCANPWPVKQIHDDLKHD